MNLFETATREKYRFPYKGQIGVEDLWDVPVTGLDSIFKALKVQGKKTDEEGLLSHKTSADAELDNKIEIVRYIFGVKMAEKAKREEAVKRKAEKEKLLEILSEKEDNALKNLSVDELRARIAAID